MFGQRVIVNRMDIARVLWKLERRRGWQGDRRGEAPCGYYDSGKVKVIFAYSSINWLNKQHFPLSIKMCLCMCVWVCVRAITYKTIQSTRDQIAQCHVLSGSAYIHEDKVACGRTFVAGDNYDLGRQFLSLTVNKMEYTQCNGTMVVMSCAVSAQTDTHTHIDTDIDEHDTRHPTQTIHLEHISVHSVERYYVVRAFFSMK